MLPKGLYTEGVGPWEVVEPYEVGPSRQSQNTAPCFEGDTGFLVSASLSRPSNCEIRGLPHMSVPDNALCHSKSKATERRDHKLKPLKSRDK